MRALGGPGRVQGLLVMLFAVDRPAFESAKLELAAVFSHLTARARVVDDEVKVFGVFALLPDDRAHLLEALRSDDAVMSLKRQPPEQAAAPTRFFSLLFDVADADRLRILALCDALGTECGHRCGDTAWLEHAAVMPEEKRRELIEGLEEHSVPVPRPTSAPVRAAGPLADRTIHVDASNLAWRAIELEVSPALVLTRTREALVRAGADDARIDVIFDASFFGNKRGAARRVPRAEWARLERGIEEKRWRRTPASTKTDEQILGRMRSDPAALVVSNDMFHREREAGEAPDDLFDRHIKVDIGPRDLRLSFPRTWRDAPNIVVPLR